MMRILTVCRIFTKSLILSLGLVAAVNAVVVIPWDVDPTFRFVNSEGAVNAHFGTRFTAEPIVLANQESEVFEIHFKDLETGLDQAVLMTHTLGFPYPESFNTIPITAEPPNGGHFADGYGPGIIIGGLTDYASARATLSVELLNPGTFGDGNVTSFTSTCFLGNGNCEAISSLGEEAHNQDLTDGSIRFKGFRMSVFNIDSADLIIREIGFNLTASGGIQTFTEQPVRPQIPGPTVPIPAAVYLFCSGMLALLGMARRKKTA